MLCYKYILCYKWIDISSFHIKEIRCTKFNFEIAVNSWVAMDETQLFGTVLFRGEAPPSSQEKWSVGFSVGSQRALKKWTFFKKLTRIIKKELEKKMKKKDKSIKEQALNGCSVGFSVRSQRVPSGYSVSTQGIHGYSCSDWSFLSTHGVLR